MSGLASFTDAQKADIRRFAGYNAIGAANSGFDAFRFFQAWGLLEFKLNNLSLEEAAIITTTYLPNLYALETALYGASASLQAQSAASYIHNPNEVRDRKRLFDLCRKELCGFLGVPPGDGMRSAGLSLVA